ncbi:hypothetical protein [Rugosimonospora africana]|uniref:hypothetical protein n=1 Tax=Rugosimonospora africana TaxID=556532 RepID=UPI0019410F91|nr:hypothetical protein [Rugosimonospora africana]
MTENEAPLVWAKVGDHSANLRWRLGDGDFEIHTTYIGAGLAPVVAAALNLQRGSTESWCALEGEPSGTLILLSQSPVGPAPQDRRLFVQVIDFSRLRTWSNSRVRWSGWVPTAEFVAAVEGMTAAVLREHGEAGYLKWWGGVAFPTEMHRQLRNLLNLDARRFSSTDEGI